MKRTSFIVLTFFFTILLGCDSNDSSDDQENPPGGGSGVYAVYSTGSQWADRSAFLWKDDVQTDLSNQNQESNLYVTAVAVSSAGDVYVVGGEGLTARQDLPGSNEHVDNVNTVLWKNGVKQNLNATPVPRWFMKGQDVDLALNNSDDVFVLGKDGASNSGEYSIWKNGNRILEMDDSEGSISPTKLFVKNNDVYVCGDIDDYPTPRRAVLWKNGVLMEVNSDSAFASCVYVSDANDVYLGLGNGTVMKNNAPQVILRSAGGNAANRVHDIFCKGTDVYVLGYTTANESIIWKNGTQLHQLTTASTAHQYVSAKSLFVMGDDVYTSAVLTGDGSNSAAVIYKNGTLFKTMYNGNGILVDAPSVFVK